MMQSTQFSAFFFFRPTRYIKDADNLFIYLLLIRRSHQRKTFVSD